MTKSFKSTKEVQSAREQGKAFVFNMVTALSAVQTTPAHTRSGATSALRENILAIYNEVKTPLAVNQVLAGLKAGGMEVTSKQVSDKLWGMAKSGVLKKSEAKGVYELA